MTGIEEMFAEYSHAQCDDFKLAFALERLRRMANDRERTRYQRVKCDPVRREKLKAYKRKYVTEYVKNRLRTDPVWAEGFRAKRAAAEARRRQARKLGEMEAAA